MFEGREQWQANKLLSHLGLEVSIALGVFSPILLGDLEPPWQPDSEDSGKDGFSPMGAEGTGEGSLVPLSSSRSHS